MRMKVRNFVLEHSLCSCGFNLHELLDEEELIIASVVYLQIF
jgi:hypothetical protein